MASPGAGGGRTTAGGGEGAAPSEGLVDGSVAPARSSISMMTQVPNLARDRVSSCAGAVANPAARSRQDADGSAATMSIPQDARPRMATREQALARTLRHIQIPTFHWRPRRDGVYATHPGRRGEPPRPKRAPNSRPGRHSDLAGSGVVGLDLRVAPESDRDLGNRHRVVHDVAEWDSHPPHAVGLRRIDAPASLRGPTPAYFVRSFTALSTFRPACSMGPVPINLS